MRVLVLSICMCYGWTMGKLNGDNPKYSNIWAVKIQGGEVMAQMVARDLGFSYKGQLGQFEDYYELVRDDQPEVSSRDSSQLTRGLLEVNRVKWAKQQMLVRPVSHDFTENVDEEELQYSDVVKYLREQAEIQSKTSVGICKPIFSCLKCPQNIQSYLISVGQQQISKLGTFPTEPFPKENIDSYVQSSSSVQVLQSKEISAYVLMYNDPFWGKQWNMQDYRTKDMPVKDLNVVPVHKMGLSGKGVTVAVVDNGVEHDNPDLVANFVTELSYDMCEDKPGSWPDKGQPHGTQCAGVIAMTANNEKCGVGIAYKANIVGIKAVCKRKQPKSAIPKALVHHIDKIDVYSVSWGVSSKDRFLYDRVELYRDAYRQGTTKGRQRNGVIYVQTAGNEKLLGENCAVNHEVNNPYVITIAGADQYGRTTPYSERCSAVFATAYTSSKGTEGIVAPDLKGECTDNFEGTSAACPQAAGIIALTLQANPQLTYRDVMHLVTMSAEVAPLADNPESWYKNGRGFLVSNDFGFGLLNAENMVVLAKDWKNVPELRICIEPLIIEVQRELRYGLSVTAPFQASACKGSPSEVNYIEHVEVISKVDFPRRGNIVMSLTSPSGTTTQILESRLHDNNKHGLEGWRILSTHNWGESAQGLWNVVYKIVDPVSLSFNGKVVHVNLVLYGTKDMPAHYAKPREYAEFRFFKGSNNYPTTEQLNKPTDK